jgi:hypothetical protein
MVWEPRKPKWRWRDYLTAAERRTIAKADAAKKVWLRLNAERAKITNRAIHRAKFDALAPGGRT